MNLSFSNRRKYSRAVVNVEADYSISKRRLKNKYEDDWVNCELYDISQNGLSLRVKQILVKDEPIKIRITFEKKMYIFDALIMNVNGQRIGVKYYDLKDSNKEIRRSNSR